MGENSEQILDILRRSLHRLSSLDFGQIKYSDLQTAVFIGLALAIVLSVKIIGGQLTKAARHGKHQRNSSGYLKIPEIKSGLTVRWMLSLPKILLVIPIFLLLVALMDPFLLTSSETLKIAETRNRIDLIDVSGSMSWRFQDGINQSKAEAVRGAHLKFLEKRRGQNDRVSLWLFSDTPHLVEDFVTDDDLYYMQVVDAPWLLKNDTFSSDLPIDRSKIYDIGESGTKLDYALTTIAQQMTADRKEHERLYGTKAANRAALLIVTDAAANQYPHAGLAKLKEARIVPYIIFIASAANSPAKNYETDNANARMLLDEISQYGGKYFNATDEKELQKAYEEIDRLETTKIRNTHTVRRLPLYKPVLALAIVCLASLLFIGLFTEFGWGRRT